MKPYSINKILVPIDLSETSLNALDAAVAIAQQHRATLVLLYVMENQIDYLMDEGMFTASNPQKGSSDVLTALVGAIQHRSDLASELLQEEGNVVEHIVRTAASSHADLIVMGTHGASGYRDGFMGSNTYSVLKHAGCPVLTIPPRRKYQSFRKILFPVRPVSGSLMRYDIVCHFLTGPATMEVFGLSYRRMDTETNVLEKIIDEIKEQLEGDKVTTKTVWGAGSGVSEDVLSHAHQYGSDMIVVTSGLDVTTKANFIGPHTQRLVNCSRVPLLVIKKLGVKALA